MFLRLKILFYNMRKKITRGFIDRRPQTKTRNVSISNKNNNDNIPINNMNIDQQYPNGEGIFSPIETENRKVIKEWRELSGNSDVVISFVSDPPGSNFYSERINILIEKIELMGYDYIITHFENDREYHQNCCYKPRYIHEKMLETGKNVIWIDGDTNLKKNLKGFNDNRNDYDIGLVTYNGDINGFVASPIYIKNNEISMDLIKEWRDHCDSEIQNGRCELDHDALKHTIIPRKKDEIRIKLNWSPENDLHMGSILENVNSNVPNKNIILRKMNSVNSVRPFNLTNQDFIIIK